MARQQQIQRNTNTSTTKSRGAAHAILDAQTDATIKDAHKAARRAHRLTAEADRFLATLDG